MSTTEDRIANELRTLLEDAIGDKILTVAELTAAGIPRRYAESIARASRNVQSSEDASKLATSWAETMATDLARSAAKGTDPAELAAGVPRW